VIECPNYALTLDHGTALQSKTPQRPPSFTLRIVSVSPFPVGLGEVPQVILVPPQQALLELSTQHQPTHLSRIVGKIPLRFLEIGYFYLILMEEVIYLSSL